MAEEFWIDLPKARSCREDVFFAIPEETKGKVISIQGLMDATELSYGSVVKYTNDLLHDKRINKVKVSRNVYYQRPYLV